MPGKGSIMLAVRHVGQMHHACTINRVPACGLGATLNKGRGVWCWINASKPWPAVVCGLFAGVWCLQENDMQYISVAALCGREEGLG
jgi:hypothetical protein